MKFSWSSDIKAAHTTILLLYKSTDVNQGMEPCIWPGYYFVNLNRSSRSPLTWLNAFCAAGECRRQVKQINKFCKKCQNCWISSSYSESAREMHSNKYQHAWYWFSNSWNNLWNVRILRKQTQFCSVKPMPCVVSVEIAFSALVFYCWETKFPLDIVYPSHSPDAILWSWQICPDRRNNPLYWKVR